MTTTAVPLASTDSIIESANDGMEEMTPVPRSSPLSVPGNLKQGSYVSLSQSPVNSGRQTDFSPSNYLWYEI